MKTYEFLVSLCGGWCEGHLNIYAKDEDESYDLSMDTVRNRLLKAFPEFDILYSVELKDSDIKNEEVVVKCKDCGKEILEEYAIYGTFDGEDGYMCDDCSTHYMQCEDCREYFSGKTREVYSLRGGCLCEVCYENDGWRWE